MIKNKGIVNKKRRYLLEPRIKIQNMSLNTYTHAYKVEKEKCFFCRKFITDDGNTVEDIQEIPQGIKRIVEAAETRNDYISLQIISLKDAINREPDKFRFHSACKQIYYSNHKVKKKPKLLFSNKLDEKTFSIEAHCLFCGKDQQKKARGNFHKISKSSAPKMREKILRAAIERGDQNMHSRIQRYINLFEAKARYHKHCYGLYTNASRIASCKKNIIKNEKKLAEKNPVKIAFSKLCLEIEKDVLINKNSKTVISLSNRLDQILAQMKVPEDVDQGTYRMRKKLEMFFGQTLSFASWSGKPSIVYSTDAEYDILASSVQQSFKRNDELKTDPEKEMGLLHKATKILREKISETLKHGDGQIPDALYKFISWILDEKSVHETSSQTPDENVVAICTSLLETWKKKPETHNMFYCDK